MARVVVMGLAALILGGSGKETSDVFAADSWASYHGDPGGSHYSTLEQIDVHNVGKLKLAWTYDTGESLGEGLAAGDVPLGSDMQSNPLVVRRQLFFISPKGTLIFPGLDGGGEWGGASSDPETSLLYVNANEMAWILRLKKRPPMMAGPSGRAVYLNNCAVCHGEDRGGSPPEFPSLVDVGSRLEPIDIFTVISAGSGRMPGFAHLDQSQIGAVIGYLLMGDKAPAMPETVSAANGKTLAAPTAADPYIFDSYKKFLDPDGYPAIAPPWGTLSAIDLNTGKYVWRPPLGEYPDLAAEGIKNSGSENYGGSIVTAGGLLFIGATVYDNKFRAFDKHTGKRLWEATLPAGGNATPSTYRINGRQFVVIPAGGGKNTKAKPGSTIMAFALPNEQEEPKGTAFR